MHFQRSASHEQLFGAYFLYFVLIGCCNQTPAHSVLAIEFLAESSITIRIQWKYAHPIQLKLQHTTWHRKQNYLETYRNYTAINIQRRKVPLVFFVIKFVFCLLISNVSFCDNIRLQPKLKANQTVFTAQSRKFNRIKIEIFRTWRHSRCLHTYVVYVDKILRWSTSKTYL